MCLSVTRQSCNAQGLPQELTTLYNVEKCLCGIRVACPKGRQSLHTLLTAALEVGAKVRRQYPEPGEKKRNPWRTVCEVLGYSAQYLQEWEKVTDLIL